MLSVQGLIRAHSPGRSPRDWTARGREGEQLREAISALPERERLALALRVYESLSTDAIAGILDLDAGATRRLLLEAAGAVAERLRARPGRARGAGAGSVRAGRGAFA